MSDENTTMSAENTDSTTDNRKARRDALISSIRYSIERLTCEELERVEAYITRLW